MTKNFSELNAKNLGIAGGILWGLTIFVLTLLSVFTGYASQYLNVIRDIYFWYDITIAGSFIGLLHGFICGFIALYLIAWRLFLIF